MASKYITFPSDKTLTGALALCLVIVVVVAATTAAALALGWGFTRLSPSGRADLVRFVRAARRR